MVRKKRKSVPITKIDPEILDLTISPPKKRRVIAEIDILSSDEGGDGDGDINDCKK